jgi:hypothetical protein
MLERIWNSVKTDADLIFRCRQLNEGLRTMEKLIKTAHEMEQTLGNLLTEDALRRLGNAFGNILVNELEHVPNYESRIDTIMERVIGTISLKRVTSK